MVYQGKQLHNDQRDLEAIADGYESKLQAYEKHWIVYALQKDAIQNSWDARYKNNGTWGVHFSLVTTDKGRFLVITDRGTTGLTGNVWESEEELTELIDSGKSSENLAYFLSSNFSSKTSTSGGKRGRGKSLFLVASEDSTFFFESLREDNEHVFGGQKIGRKHAIEVELSTSRNFIQQAVNHKLGGLTTPGTRIFIKNPSEVLVESISNGVLKGYVEETWWEIIKKYGSLIAIEQAGNTQIAEVPPAYDDQELENSRDFEIREYKNIEIRSENQKYRLKRIKLIYVPDGNISDNIKGLAIQRNGMTIERRATERLVKEKGMEKVYGWVEMEPSTEQAMYELEDVEHLKFNWVRNPAKKILSEIQGKTRAFAKEVKIIESERSKQHNLYKNVEDDVANRINKYLMGLGFRGFSQGSTTTRAHTRDTDFPIRISMSEFVLPSRNKRVDFGQNIQALGQVINELDHALNIRVRYWIVSKNGQTIRHNQKDIVLGAKTTYKVGWEKIEINESEFSKGDYSFRAKIVLLGEVQVTKKGGEILLEKGYDQIKASSSFCVDKDPQQHGFMRFEATDKATYLESYREDNEVVIEYGTAHPYITQFLDPDKKDELNKFLTQNGIVLALDEVLAEDFGSENPKVFKGLDAENAEPHQIVSLIMQYAGIFLGGAYGNKN